MVITPPDNKDESYEEKVLSRVNIIAKNEGIANFRARILSCHLADKTGHPITYKLSKGWVEECGYKAININMEEYDPKWGNKK